MENQFSSKCDPICETIAWVQSNCLSDSNKAARRKRQEHVRPEDSIVLQVAVESCRLGKKKQLIIAGQATPQNLDPALIKLLCVPKRQFFESVSGQILY
jgi:hypothetical protein